MDVIKGYCVYTNRYIQGTYKWYVRGRGNKDKHEAFHGYAVCISLILGSTLQSYPWYIAVLVGEAMMVVLTLVDTTLFAAATVVTLMTFFKAPKTATIFLDEVAPCDYG